MHPIIRLLSTSAALSLILAAPVANASEESLAGDPQAGETKSATCVACHGPDGISQVPTFPKLAGQQSGYIAKQLSDFKSGTRADDTMKGMVAALSDQDMLDLDAFYASKEIALGEITQDNEEAAKAGEEIYRAGLAEFSVTPCMACHQPDGQGLQPLFPGLAGQHATYIEKQLMDFKTGARIDTMMNDIAFPLSEEQIKNLALYVSGLY